MQPEPKYPRVFYHSAIDWKDEFEEKYERARAVLTRIVPNGVSEREYHDILTNSMCRDQRTHDDVSIGLLANILTTQEISIAVKNFRDLTFLSRDNINVVAENLSSVILDKYLKLTDCSRNQIVWIVKEMIKVDIPKSDMLCWNLLRQVAGGDISNRNLWLAESVLDIIAENRVWLKKYPILIASVIYTYLRILEDHFSPTLTNLRQKEAIIVSSLIRENFYDVCMNPQIGLGRDFIRLIQSVSRIPEIDSIFKDIAYNPKSLSIHLNGLDQLLNIRTSRKFLQSRLTPEMEKKISFLSFQVRFGMQKRYQDWFQRQFLSTPESQTLRADIIRFIVGVVHPPNEILCSDILPRWAVIGWLLSSCTNPVANANAKLALFYDWLFFDPFKDNIMNIEPGILVMHHSLRTHVTITATLLDFLIKLTYEYWLDGIEKIKDSVGAALRSILDKKVLQTLDPLLAHTRLDADLRVSIQEKLVVLLDRGNGGGGNGNGNPNSGSVELVILDDGGQYPGNQQETILISGGGGGIMQHHQNNLPAIIPPNGTVPNNNKELTTSSNKLVNKSPMKSIKPTKSPNPNPISIALPIPIPPPQTTSIETIRYSDEETSESDDELIQTPSTGISSNVPTMRNSPTIGTSVEEAEKSKIFEIINTLPTKFRMPLETLAIENSLSIDMKSEQAEEIIDDLADPNIEIELRDKVLKCLMYIFKSELLKPSANVNSKTIIEELTITPVSELLTIIQGMKGTEKSPKKKNLNAILTEIINHYPAIAYKIILMIHNFSRSDYGSSSRPSPNQAKEKDFKSLYKNIANSRGLKIETALTQDLKVCWNSEPYVVGYLCPIIFNWFGTEIIGSVEILQLIVSAIDPSQLQEIVWKVMQSDIELFDENVIVPFLSKTLEWDTWEQNCIWTLISAHNFSTESFLPIIPQLDCKNNPEALTFLLLRLKNEKPTTDILDMLLCRKPSQKDKFILSLLNCWSEDDEEAISDLLATLLVRASGSPVKRKRGSAKGNSPAQPALPTVENCLAHLEHFRKFTLQKDGGVFARDAMQAGLLQVQSWVTETQRTKYRELLALAPEPEPKDSSRSISKRSTTNSGGIGVSSSSSTSSPRKIPGSPTSSSTTVSSSNTSSSTGTTTARTTRSGKTRTNLREDSSEDSSEEEEFRKIRSKKRRKVNVDSDSD